jgi:NRAMP (natural resistance-associated macrophage protein)-like metal ion transporter
MNRTITPTRNNHRLYRLLRSLGPGIITGASDDDPSGVATYTQAGASLGYATLWTALVTFPMMAAVQLICARIGLVTGKGISSLLHQHYSARISYPAVLALVIANAINAGTDLGAIAAGINLLLPVPIFVLVGPIALLILLIQFFGSYRFIARIFSWLSLALFAYIGAAFCAKPDWPAVLKGTFLPTIRLDGMFVETLLAICGTTISPYLFFWQASQEVEEKAHVEKRDQRKLTANAENLANVAWDVNLGMLFSNVVMYFIILATAATLHESGQTDIQTATEAAEALRPLAGGAATILFAVGLISTGFLTVPILTTSAAYAVAEVAHWKRHSLDEKPGQAKKFYFVIAATTLIGLALNFTGINPMKALYWTAVINGFLAGPLLVLIMRIANNKTIMKKSTNQPLLNILGWTTTVVMFLSALGLVVTWIFPHFFSSES